MRVPFRSPLLAQGERLPASFGQAHKLSLGVHWQRKDKQLVAESFQYVEKGARKKVEIPKKTTTALYDEGSEKIYILSERISQDPLENYFGKQSS